MCGNISNKVAFLCVAMFDVATHFLLREKYERGGISMYKNKYKSIDVVNGLHNDFSRPQPKKDASIIGRSVVGGILAGPAGAVVGAISALNKNMKKR